MTPELEARLQTLETKVGISAGEQTVFNALIVLEAADEGVDTAQKALDAAKAGDTTPPTDPVVIAQAALDAATATDAAALKAVQDAEAALTATPPPAV